MQWQAPGGQLNDGILTYPNGYTSNGKYPLVVFSHGGPEGASTEHFSLYEFGPLRELFALSGTADVTVPITQSYTLYHALSDRHVPVEFIGIPGGPHTPHDPVHLELYYRAVDDWVATRLRLRGCRKRSQNRWSGYLISSLRKTSLMTSQIGGSMKSWPVQDAKARFSEFLKASLTEGPQVVTLRGVETAVLVPMQEWRSLHERARPSLKALLLAPEARGGLNLPPRGHLRRRTPRTMD